MLIDLHFNFIFRFKDWWIITIKSTCLKSLTKVCKLFAMIRLGYTKLKTLEYDKFRDADGELLLLDVREHRSNSLTSLCIFVFVFEFVSDGRLLLLENTSKFHPCVIEFVVEFNGYVSIFE